MKITLRYLCEDRDRHGNIRLYVRRNGRKVRIRERWGTLGFVDAYHAALTATELGQPERDSRAIVKRGSLSWLTHNYYNSPEFKQLAPCTQRVRRGILDSLSATHGAKPFNRLEPHHVRKLRDAKADFPEA